MSTTYIKNSSSSASQLTRAFLLSFVYRKSIAVKSDTFHIQYRWQ